MTEAGSDLPSLELLCYHQAAPMLRVVDPSSGDQRPFSSQKTFRQAVDVVLAREGWVAGWASYTYRFLPVREAKPKRVERGRPFIGSMDRRCIWIPHSRTWKEYDGIADEYHREVDLGSHYLSADTPQGFVIVDLDQTIRLVDREDPSSELKRWSAPEPPFAANDSTLIWREGDNRLLVEHLDTGEPVSVTLPLWRMHHSPAGPASFSPDGRRLALTGDSIVGPIPFDIGVTEREKRKRQGSSLVIVDLIDGSAELVVGHFENFAYRPVWSADGAWIFFGAPFENATYAICVDGPARAIRRVPGLGRSAAMPMIDLESARAGTTRD